MNLTWHIAKKDLRRLRWPLVLLGAVVLLQYVMWLMARADGDQYRPVAVALWGMHLLVAWLLVPQFVQEDGLVGLAGWRVRPISGARLLAAKALGIFLGLCLWPSVLTLPWWLEFGFGAGEIAHVIAVNTLGMMMLTGVALLIATLTEDFAKFIAMSLITAVAGGLIALMLAAAIPANGDGAVAPAITMTRAALAWGVVLASVAVIVPLQFVGRRAGWARGLAIGAGVFAAAVALAWPTTLAQMKAATGLRRFALPKVTASLGETQLVMPSAATQRPAAVRVTTKVAQQGMQAGDIIAWSKVEPAWTLGGERRPPLLLAAEYTSQGWEMQLAEWAKGSEVRHDNFSYSTWTLRFPSEAAPLLRNGEGLLTVRNQGTLWRVERGPTVPLRAGVGAVRGLRQVHVVTVEEDLRPLPFQSVRRVRWLEIDPLFLPAGWLELINPDGIGRHRWKPVLLSNGGQELADFHPEPDYEASRPMVGRNKLLIGVVGMNQMGSSFNWRWWLEDPLRDQNAVPLAGARLTSLVIEEAAPIDVPLKETQVVPDLVIEGSLEETLRRARAEDRSALVRVGVSEQKAEELLKPRRGQAARELLTKRFVVGQANESESARLRKSTDDANAVTLVVFDSRGEERDRLRDLEPTELQTALQANLDGKTYAAVVLEKLNASGGQDRKLRFQLHEALRARGELKGAFDAILWLVENPRADPYLTEMADIGFRLERMVAMEGSVKADLLKLRERAIEILQRDPAHLSAARALFVITQGLQHDDAVWLELPRLVPRENPLWWEVSASWLGRMAQQKRYREAVMAMDVEKFFAAGPEWVRGNLAKRPAQPAVGVVPILAWQRRLAHAGENAVEVLAGAQEEEAALRVARAVRRIDRTTRTREQLAQAMTRAQAAALAEQFLKEEAHDR